MDPVIAEVYSTVLPAAPFVVAAYVGMWIVLAVFIIATVRKASKTQSDIKVLREAIEHLEIKNDK